MGTLPSDIRELGERLCWPATARLEPADLSILGFDPTTNRWDTFDITRTHRAGRTVHCTTARLLLDGHLTFGQLESIADLTVDPAAFVHRAEHLIGYVVKTATFAAPRVSSIVVCTLGRGTHYWYSGLDSATSKDDLTARAALAWTARSCIDPNIQRVGRPRGSGRFEGVLGLVHELRRYIAEHGCEPPSKAAFSRWAGASVDTVDRALRRPGFFGTSTGSFRWSDVVMYAKYPDIYSDDELAEEIS